MAQNGPEDGSDALIRPQNFAKAASAEQTTARRVASLKVRTGQTVADGPRFSDFPVTATTTDPLAMATRKIKNKPTGVKRSRSRNPGAGPSKPLEPGQPDRDEDSTCWRGCRDPDCTDRYPHEDCYDSEAEREVIEWLDKK
jgi:hypothetical protein